MIERVLIPTDFSESSRHALKYAVDLNKLLGLTARLYLLHVLQDFTEFSEYDLSPTILPQLYVEFEENAAKRLEEMVSTLVPREVCCDTYILHGVPFHEILQFAYRERIDLIVIGARGRTGIKNVLFGHTAEKVVKKSPCPVLSVRHPNTVFAMP
ncbi:MAG: universal stress protein [Desulfomonilia bacterium]|jgi:nucleotide-binding universal stress UspA family protein|uniref:Stress response protein NhaX n=1 Tax=anaerobic digester metagenome TaxID=1263854 RepID=A0A485M623_9ZZZZ|nr:universal stress protein [Pseudomonadota bacterium]HON38220.1 universal stress protein [Deltaproteobacteria bacterium]HRS56070.1 universal stress protein [Desulfomonilia bacterium]HPD21548.1 universal stress protein [Deltaproteobacteria bacterium]HPX19772.1 universal stress protein [Deltaproteobacteria bacterium]